jgi:FkbM family methyltransferase
MKASIANSVINTVLPGEVRRKLKHMLPRAASRAIEKARYLSAMREGTDSYEPEMSIIHTLFKRGDCVADLGASVGWYTRFFAGLVGPEGLVCSCEPNAENFEVLTYIKKKLRLDNVNLFNVAVSNASGTATMIIPRNEDTGEPDTYRTQVVSATSGAAGDDAITVQTSKLDDLTRRTFAFIKCDVEGHEFDVLGGAASVLASGPAWMIEVWGHPDKDPKAKETFALMASTGYSAYILDETETALRERKPGEEGVRGNYFFLQAKHLPLLDLR